MADRPAPPKIDSAPGLIWRTHKHCWEARWHARSDLAKRGYPIKGYRLWLGKFTDGPPNHEMSAHIQGMCIHLQDEMIAWGRGAFEQTAIYDCTIAGLIHAYKTDDLSSYHKLRHHSRTTYDHLMGRIEQDIGTTQIHEIKARNIHDYYSRWSNGGRVSMSHSLMAMMRILMSFGLAFLEDDQCARVSAVLSKLRFRMAPSRTERLTADQAVAARVQAHQVGWHSMALAQAFQFDCMLRQKDVIGEYIPMSEPIVTDVIVGNDKWARGLRWDEIDENLVLHHITSKKQKMIHIPLAKCPMVMEELGIFTKVEGRPVTRADLPASGPIILHDRLQRPWGQFRFRQVWREVATGAGIPKHVRNMDSRAGGVSEAIEAGASLEHVRHAATHSDVATTQRYDRGAENNVISVLEKRAAYRNKRGEQ